MTATMTKKWFVGFNGDIGKLEAFQVEYDNDGPRSGPWSEVTGKFRQVVGPFRTKGGAEFMVLAPRICPTVRDAEQLAKLDRDPMPGRVDMGARLMDRYRPGWYRRINRATLDMSKTDCCIIGQTWDGDYLAGLVEMGLKDRERDHGFDIPADLNWTSGNYTPLSNDQRDKLFARMTRLWQKEIAKRLKGDN
jgi:hypothetical protein